MNLRPLALFVPLIVAMPVLGDAPPAPHALRIHAQGVPPSASPAPVAIQASEAVAPLLHVTVVGPEGTSVTFLEGPKTRKTFDAPVTVGLRPGFVYRLRFDGKELRNVRRGGPDAKPEPLYASLEVGGTLRLPSKVKAAEFPAPVALTPTDVERIFAGAVVTKVILLEDPDRADAKRDADHRIVELDARPGEDLFASARELGRPLAILRIGGREPDPEQLARQKSGNILYPGEASLPPIARDPNQVPIDMRPFFRPPEECIRDGGDGRRPVHIDFGGQVEGLDPADTIAEYIDSKGIKKLAITNRVCICVPRFLAVRQDTPLVGIDGVQEHAHAQGHEQHARLDGKQGLRDNRKLDEPETLRGRTNLRANVSIDGPGTIFDIHELRGVQMDLGPAGFLGTEKVRELDETKVLQLKRQVEFALNMSAGVGPKRMDAPAPGPIAVGIVEGTSQVQGRVETKSIVYICKDGEKPEVPEQPLQVLKWASTDSAKIGDVVTFFIRYSNTGGKPINHVAVTDSLTARLEYIPGSAKTDREAIFVTQANEADSLTLRWEIRDPLPPGARGVVSFQARIK